MKITVHVKARSKKQEIKKREDGVYDIWVHAVREKGKANEAVIEIISHEFKKPKTYIRIISGETSSKKIIEIL
jgi:uncharacterized protein YggU (UPF0235/DUF167 family)